MSNTVYGDISPRTAAYVVKDLLKRGMPYLIFEKFGQAKPLPNNSTKSIKFRRYFISMNSGTFSPYAYFETDGEENFKPSSKVLSEGVTPTATALEKQDISATLVQRGDLVTISDVIIDTHEDNILKEAVDVLGEQAAIVLEKARFNILVAGTNVGYSNSDVERTAVDTAFSAGIQRVATRTLKRQLAKAITSVVRSTANYGTEAIAPSFMAIAHPDLEYDIRKVASFVPAEKYGTMTPYEGEIGKIGDCRYLLSTICEPFAGGGETRVAQTVLYTDVEGTDKCDVYPILYFARDAYGLVPLKGKDSITPMVVNPKPSDSDPLAQRGHVSWKAMTTTIILNDAWMYRAEVACTDDDNLSD